tara:strand:+ start:9789 stop:10118 length:330 start_codon:yes stop_codon:yes gene_type:complete
MSDFMNSEFVREGLDNIERLQSEVFDGVFDYSGFDYDDKREHLEKMEELIEAQKIMYTRMSLSDDPAAIERREQIEQFVKVMGFEGTDVHVVFSEMHRYLEQAKKELDT